MLTEDAFWQWSLKVYSHDGIKNACLKLQNQHGLNVNVLLLNLWLAFEHSLIINRQQLRAVIKDSAFAMSQADQLRSVRNHLAEQNFLQPHPLLEECHGVTLDAELIAEKYTQSALVDSLQKKSLQKVDKSSDAAIENLDGYLEQELIEAAERPTISRELLGFFGVDIN